MAVRLGDEAPNFNATTTEGDIDFHAWLGQGWGILFSHPADFTPVCTTELGTVAKLKGEFDQCFYDLLVRGTPNTQPRTVPAPVRLPYPAAKKGGSIYENQKGTEKRFFETYEQARKAG